MSTIHALSDADQETQSPLSLVGGFDAYQRMMQDAIRAAAKDMKLGDIERIDATLSPEDKMDGLEQGLMGILNGSCQIPLTDRNLETLESLFPGEFSRMNTMRPHLEPHLTHGSPGDPIGLFIDRHDPRSMDRRSGELFTKGINVARASDVEIQKRRTFAREQALQSFSVMASQGV